MQRHAVPAPNDPGVPSWPPAARALAAENLELRARLEEAEEALRAIREGEVDAVIVSGSKGDRVFSLTETENLHRLMVETMNEAGLATSSDGLLLYANDRATALLGRGRSGLLGHPIEEFVTPDHLPRLRRLLDGSHAGTADDRIVFVTASGSEVPMHLWASHLPRPGEAMICLVGTDLSRLEAEQALLAELREHQQSLKASRAEALERLSQALIAQDQAARLAQQLREGDRRKDAFLATLAHELRNPLAPIRNALEILRLQEAGTPAVVEAREMMERHLAHLVRLVDDLMDVARITHGKIALLKQRLALASVIGSAVEAVRPLLQTADQRVTVDLPPGDLWIEGDPTRLAQVFGNLLHNAIKYSEPGQTIRIIARPHPGGEVKVSVEDSGAGIPAHILPRVFDMFAQGHSAPGQIRGGLGIGLTLVRRLVELHSGRVEACSAGPDRGSQIHIHLPLAAGGPVAAGQPVPPADGLRHDYKGRRILVVDDNRDAATSLAKALALKGARVRVAHDGRSVLAMLEACPAELVILDIDLPDLDGHEVARRIRARPGWAQIRLIAMTGLGHAAARRRSLEVGFDHHLVKPVSFDVLDQLLAFSPLEMAGRSRAPTGTDQAADAEPSAPDSLPTAAGLAVMDCASAASLLHDLAQPLSAAGCLAVAARMLAGRVCAEATPVHEAIHGIEEQVQVASRILDQLRKLLGTSGQGPARPTRAPATEARE